MFVLVIFENSVIDSQPIFVHGDIVLSKKKDKYIFYTKSYYKYNFKELYQLVYYVPKNYNGLFKFEHDYDSKLISLNLSDEVEKLRKEFNFYKSNKYFEKYYANKKKSVKSNESWFIVYSSNIGNIIPIYFYEI